MGLASNDPGRACHQRNIPMHISPYKEERTFLLSLFAMADDSTAQIATYLSLGEILVARDGDLVIGHLQIVETDDGGVFELKSIAVTEKRQREGIGRGLIAAAIAHCRVRGGRRLIVATAAADIGNLRFYQQQGGFAWTRSCAMLSRRQRAINKERSSME
jgi:GNAT superfamily N-acetyltransferase